MPYPAVTPALVVAWIPAVVQMVAVALEVVAAVAVVAASALSTEGLDILRARLPTHRVRPERQSTDRLLQAGQHSDLLEAACSSALRAPGTTTA